MHRNKPVYHTLIVSATDSFSSIFHDLLPETRYAPVHTVSSIRAAKQALTENSYDFIIINSPLPDNSGTQFAIELSTTQQAVILIIIRADLYAVIHDKVAEHGVFTLSKPVPKHTLEQALYWMESARERLRYLEKKTLSMEAKLSEIRLVNKAKWLLIAELKMSESDAHRYIEKQSMDYCLPKKIIAEDIIKAYA